MNLAIRDFLINASDTVGTTISITGLSFTPTCGWLEWNGLTDTADAISAATHRRGFGQFSGTANRAAVVTQSVHTPTSATADMAQSDQCCVLEVSSASVITGKADVDAMLSDGVRFIIDDQFVASVRVRVVLIDAATVTTGTVTEPNGVTGNLDTTSLGWRPKLVTIISASLVAAEATGTDSRCMVGAFDDFGGQAVWTGGSNDAQPTMVTGIYHTDAECLAALNTNLNAVSTRAAGSMLSNGFRLNFTETDNVRILHWMAVSDPTGEFAVGGGTTQTDTTTPITMPGGSNITTLIGGIVISGCAAESASDTVTTNDQWSMGAFASASDRFALATIDEHGTPTAEVAVALELDSVYANISTAAAIEGLMDVNSMSGKTYIMDDADPSAAFFFNVLFGNAAAGGGGFATRKTLLGVGI